MSAEQLARVRALFDAALDLPEAERRAFIEARTDDADLRANVLELLGYLDEQAAHRTRQPLAALLTDVARQEAEPATPRRLGRYELFEPLGAGGMGRVYRARRIDDTEHWLALKVIRGDCHHPAMSQRFASERQILARLNHPNIAHFIDADSAEDGTTFVAMELVEGESLRAYVAAHGLDLDARLQLFRQLLSAVAHAHRSLVIHRDIKPENVMVRADGVLKLLDFGIAKLLADDGAHTQTRERMFTPANAAPEQILGEPCDATTDVYALGTVLYELVTGVPAFEIAKRTPGELEQDILKVPPAPMRTRSSAAGIRAQAIPNDLENIVQKALRKEPSGRYGSVEQLDADLARLLAHQPVSVSGNGMLYRARKLIERHALASALLVLTATAVLGALVVVIAQNRTVVAERDRATLALNVLRDAFLAADPDGMTGGDVSARQILEQSTSAMTPLIDRGDQHWRALLLALTEVQVSMGLLVDAEKSLAWLGSARDQDALACVLYARVLAERDEVARAERQLLRCPGGNDKADRLAELVRARLALKMGDYAGAERRFGELSQRFDSREPLWGYVQQQYADALASAGQLERALAHLDAVEQQARRVLDANHPGIARLQLARIEAMASAGDNQRLFDQGARIIATTLQPKYGSESVLVGRAESLVGQALLRAGRYGQASAHLRNAWQSFRAVLGETHEITLRSELNLALALAGSGSDESALRAHFEHVSRASAGTRMPAFHAFARLQQGKWLARRTAPADVEQALTQLRLEQDSVADLDDATQNEFSQWLLYAYWKLPCAKATGAFDNEAVCASQPSDIAQCQAAHRRLCAGTAVAASGRPKSN